MQEKLEINMPVIVEGKYDKITLSSVISANIIPVGGFSVFKQKEKTALLRRLAEAHGIIVLTDSDGAGRLIRAHLSSVLPREKIFHLYIPSVEGKESRKKTASKEGLLGVEGIDADRLRAIFAPFATNGSPETAKKTPSRPIEKRDFYAAGLSGGAGAAARREALAAAYGLPRNMTANALLEALNLLSSYEEYARVLAALDAKENEKGEYL